MTANLSLCELVLPTTSFAEDLRLTTGFGFTGISIVDGKVSDRPAEHLAAFTASGLRAAACCPTTWSILPVVPLPEPADVGERVAAIGAAVATLAPFRPHTVFCATGWIPDQDESRQWSTVVAALRDIATVAAAHDVTISIEPMTARHRPPWSLITTIGDAVRLCDDVGADNLGVVVDIWHLFDTPDFLGELRRHVDRVTTVQVSDYRVPTTLRDRLLPGDGACDVPRIFGTLQEAGFAGWYDFEVFSDTLQALPPEEFVRRGAAAMRRCFDRSANGDDDGR